jgi:hypothetical protein
MNITLNLSREKKAELEERAAAAGTDLQSFILEAVEEKLEEKDGSIAQLPYDQWSGEFRSWVASHPSRNPAVDDSRNSIYD